MLPGMQGWCTRPLSSPTTLSPEITGQCSQVHGLGVSAFGLVPGSAPWASLIAQLVKNPPAMQELLSHFSSVRLCVTP